MVILNMYNFNGGKMEQKIFGNRAHRFETETLRSEFDGFFDANNSVVARRLENVVHRNRREQMENRVC